MKSRSCASKQVAASQDWIQDDPGLLKPRFGPQIGLSATSMLTLIAFLFATSTMLPELGYLTILDIFIVGSTILVFLALLESLSTSYLVAQEKGTIARKIDRICRIAFPLSFTVFVVTVRLFL